MRRIGSVVACGIFLFASFSSYGESSLDVLTDELKQAQEQHADATSQMFSNFISELDKAIQSPDAALNLYQEAGGDMPTPAPVITQYDSETPSEKADRDALDQANNTNLAYVVQLHCGLMRFAGFFIEAPDQKGLQDAWITWLKSAAHIYAQVGGAPEDTRVKPAPPAADNGDKPKVPAKPAKKKMPPPDMATVLKLTTLRDSVIGSYLNFNGWDDKDQGQWRVKDLPKLYRDQVLDPSRKALSRETLADWDTFIAMKSVDEPDRDKWAQIDYPGFQFEKSCDDFAIAPSMDKLSVLVNLIKQNPTYPDLDDWISRVQQMLQDFRAGKAGGASATNATAAPAAPAPTPAPVPTPDPTPTPTPAVGPTPTP